MQASKVQVETRTKALIAVMVASLLVLYAIHSTRHAASFVPGKFYMPIDITSSAKEYAFDDLLSF